MRRFSPIIIMIWLLVLVACSPVRHVPSGEFLLNKVRIDIDSGGRDLDSEELLTYLRQQPNHKTLWSARLKLGVYNLSGSDSTKWWNHWLRKMGEPPVIYAHMLTDAGVSQLRQALINKGYLSAEVEAMEYADSLRRRMNVDYVVKPGSPHIVRSIDYEITDSVVASIVLPDTSRWTIRPGDHLDRNALDLQRQLITSRMRDRGYYNFVKEDISFKADTTAGSYDVDLTMVIDSSEISPVYGMDRALAARQFIVRNVICVTDYGTSPSSDLSSIVASDTVRYRDMTILYGPSKYLRPSVIYENNFIIPGMAYSERSVDRTYKALSRLEILKFINIRFEPAGDIGDLSLLDAYILLTPGKSQSMGVELEGTNSEGDLGVAVGVSYTHRNVGRGSETLSAKVRGAYESISGDLDGLLHNRYMEYSGDLGLQFPKFKAPFLKESFKRRVNATTHFHMSMNYQERPEYTRIISTLGWSYKWRDRSGRNRHILTPVDINYVYLPQSTYNFIDQIAPDNPLLRYSYEDHFIMRLGYSYYHTNKRAETPWQRGFQKDIYNLRVNAEIAGNFLFVLSSIFAHKSNFHESPYKIFGIHYSQYFKMDSDFAYTHRFDTRQSVATRLGFGIGIPYGNSSILPFEKRFYGGGANGVRGWTVRTLGPGIFRSVNNVSDFMEQCGDIRFIMSAEYRAKLFWIIELGAFVDVGNIWTIRDYANQPGGVFKINGFYRQMAAAYGLGIRLDFDYFLLRFDLGMKALNPAAGAVRWPLVHPRWGRDRAFHFSIGYPF